MRGLEDFWRNRFSILCGSGFSFLRQTIDGNRTTWAEEKEGKKKKKKKRKKVNCCSDILDEAPPVLVHFRLPTSYWTARWEWCISHSRLVPPGTNIPNSVFVSLNMRLFVFSVLPSAVGVFILRRSCSCEDVHGWSFQSLHITDHLLY